MIIVISDTLHYRPDGTVSGVTRVARESYTTPGGRELSEDVSSTVGIEAVTALLDGGYAAFDAHNKALETQIDTERKSAAETKQQELKRMSDAFLSERKQLADAHEAALAARDETISQKDAELAELRAENEAARDAAKAINSEAAAQP